MKKSMIVIITPTSSQPRYHKRISSLSKISDVIIFSFRRGLYEVNDFQPDLQVFDLGMIPDRKYFKRIFPFIRAIYTINSNLPSGYKTVQFYAFSVDCMLIAKIAGIRNGYLEIGDLIFSNRMKLVVKRIEKLIVNRLLGLILTSSKFYTKYYKSLISNKKKTPVYIIENKIETSLAYNRPSTKFFADNSQITIGLIGLLRYKEPIMRLINFVKRHPDRVKLKVYGDGALKAYVNKNLCKNIEYYGSYKSPYDLPNIYNQIDLNFVVYDYKKLNVRLAIPNKLYESAYFGIPLVCGIQTHLGFIARQWGIGDTIRVENQNDFDNDLNRKLNHRWLMQASSNCFSISGSQLLDDGDKIISQIFNRKV
jgi:succinoglycan biosynthesis protein ExoL